MKFESSTCTRTRQIRQRHANDSIEAKDFIARPYQVELYEICKTRNTIVCLNTGGGKTFIAVMLIKHLSPQLRVNNNTSERNQHNIDGSEHSFVGKRTFFLVPTVPLVSQQANVIRVHTDLSVGEYHGQSYDDWSVDQWHQEFQKYHVLVMIDEIFRKILFQGFLSLSKVNLVIFDEAHRAVKNHPYREIMRCFDQCDQSNRPRILGLSASLIMNNTSPDNLQLLIRTLELTLRSTCETATDLRTLNKYSSKPIEEFSTFPTFDMNINSEIRLAKYFADSCIEFLNDINYEAHIIPKTTINLKSLSKSIQDTMYIFATMGAWCALQAAVLYIRELSDTVEMLRSTKSHYTAFLSAVLTTLNVIKVNLSRLLENLSQSDQIFMHTSPKLKNLTKLLQQYSTSQNQLTVNICGIIFTERRSVARILCLWLQEVAKLEDINVSFIKADYVLGHGGRTGVGNASLNYMSDKKQEESLKRFRSHECNLLVATSVLEEGLDVPRCNLVVRYDPPKTFREYIQSKGRARAEKARFVIFDEDCAQRGKLHANIEKYKQTETLLTNYCHNRISPTEHESDESIDDQLMDPYMPNKIDGSARITLNSAIAIVNRYCLKLPSDSFTKLTPQFIIEEENDCQYRCRLSLPINSPIRSEIVGQLMPNKRTAKKACALLACEKLHMAGEIDDNFLPVGKETINEYIKSLGLEPANDELEKMEKGPRPGTTKRRQYYSKRVADVLSSVPIQPNVHLFLYEFSTSLKYAIPEAQNTRGRKITDPAETPRNFGILTAVRVPPICDFPVFTRSGEVIVKYESVRQHFTLTSQQIEELETFHKFTFLEVLRLIKNPLFFDTSLAHCKYLIAPINVVNNSIDKDIDWQFVHSIKQHKEMSLLSISEEERSNFVFDRNSYNDAVVIPWYRKDKPQFFYYVAEICDNLTPKSSFPDEGYETFEKYYLSKYNIKIMNPNQPLLDVDHTSARLNLLTPRYVNRKGISLPTSTAKTKKEKRENLQQKQILIPELCNVHPFPASFWRKAVTLPSLLYRLNSLLVAEQLRARVARETGVGIADSLNSICWPPLNFGWTNVANLQIQEEYDNKLISNTNDVDEQEMGCEIWDFPSFNNMNAIEFKDDDNNLDTDKTNENAEFVIDNFDPSKYSIDDDDPYYEDFGEEEEEELSNIEWTETINIIGGSNGLASAIPININLNIVNANNQQTAQIREIDDNDEINDYQLSSNSDLVRYGSPSCFSKIINGREGPEWDFDDGITPAAIYNIGLPGLQVISGTQGINIDGLSKDIASFPVEVFDSFDEASDFDDTDTDDYGTESEYKLENNKRKFIPNTIPDVLQYELLTYPSSTIDQQTVSNEKEIIKLCESICTDDTINESIEDKNEILDNIDQLNIEDNQNKISSDGLSMFFKDYIESENETENEDEYENNEEINENCNVVERQNVDSTDKILNLEKNSAKNESKNLIQSIPCFGDLLPDRDTSSQSREPFNVKFDHLKHNESNVGANVGPSPSQILQALTMSNASDGINLERLETVGDSFLKYAVTAYLYCVCPALHEGKLSYLRSRQISNMNLYFLGKKIGIGEFMNATKFEPIDNWCPPCYAVSQEYLFSEKRANDIIEMQSKDYIERKIDTKDSSCEDEELKIPYNLLTQHSIPDKSIADCVEALIGAYLISSGPKGALLFMKWLDLKVMDNNAIVKVDENDPNWRWLPTPKPPLLIPNNDLCNPKENEKIANEKLNELYLGHSLNIFEEKLGYSFRDKAYLVQAFTHNSYYENKITDCYQRLEFLGDAVLDYLITRYLYEDPAGHSPGTLTDLRSALVNNTFFASLAVKYEFYKYLKMLSYDLYRVVNMFVTRFRLNDERTSDYNLFIAEGESENAEDIEVPKALGDIFESVAGAIYLDSNMSLDTVWDVYFKMMKPEIEYFSTHVPKSPIRELLEMEPQNAKFGKPELITGRKIRVCVEVFGEGKFDGIGRNKRIAKCTAAKRALRALKLKRNVAANILKQ